MIAALLLNAAALAFDTTAHPFGLGVMAGYPSGISGKVYLDGQHGVDFAVASTPWRGGYVHATYLWHPSILATGSVADLGWHVGVGGFAWDSFGYDGRGPWWSRDGDLTVGVRVPIGLDVNLKDPRFQFFGDVALSAPIVPGLYAGIDGAIGARYYF
jgi:hypothetical protein